jgi:predicted protein tyrosine phosphatase
MLSHSINAEPSEKVLWINVRSPLASHELRLCQQLQEIPYDWVLTLRFDDIRVELRDEWESLKPLVLFDAVMAQSINQFASQDWDVLIVNCEAGVSRSAAVGLAIAEKFGLPDPVDYDRQSPNPVVLKILRETLKNEAVFV